MYPHSATPRIPTQSPYNTKSSPPTAYARLARPHFHHLAQTHTNHTYPTSIPPNSIPESTLLQPTRPDPRPYQKCSVHYPTNRHPYPLPTRPTLTPQFNSTTPPYPPNIIVPSKPSPLLPQYAHPAAKTLISPSKAHMSLERFCCALTIEYKCKTSHINKRL